MICQNLVVHLRSGLRFQQFSILQRLFIIIGTLRKKVWLQKALKGDAQESVKSLLIHPGNVRVVVEQFRFRYSRSEILIRRQLQ